MQVAFCAYDGMTALDFVGAYDPITRLDRSGIRPLEWDVCAPSERVTTDGLTLDADRVTPDLGAYDLLFLPGGPPARELADDERVVEWLRSAEPCRYKTSVCTGSLLLGAAGFLEGRRATTHPEALEALGAYAEATDERVVRDGPVITGRGVSSALDLGLAVVEVLTDAETRAAVAEEMDYPYGEAVFEAVRGGD
jgi:cyclohexyl-isocyanide hydratase